MAVAAFGQANLIEDPNLFYAVAIVSPGHTTDEVTAALIAELDRLKAEPRGVTVMFYSGDKSPCPCIADGAMLATQASPGQGTLQVAAEKAPAGFLAVILVRDRKSGAGVRYAIKDEWMPKILDWNKNLDPVGRYEAAMAAQDLFEVTPLR